MKTCKNHIPIYVGAAILLGLGVYCLVKRGCKCRKEEKPEENPFRDERIIAN